MKPKAAISWSGGKDSCLALMRAREDFDVTLMLTMFDEQGVRSRSHGQRPDVLRAQADRLRLDLVEGRGTWTDYERGFAEMLQQARDRRITHVIFGDILYDEHREWAERLSAGAGLVAVEPLFGDSTSDLLQEFLALPGRALIVTARQSMLGEEWLGRELGVSMIPEFARHGVDPCGENGEYHTIVVDCPAFTRPLAVSAGSRAASGGCWALELSLED